MAADGIYLEPTGEGTEADGDVWRKHVDALARLLKEIYRKRPEFEVGVAIGRFNSSDYRRAIHELAPEEMHWFWAWGDPLEDKALAERLSRRLFDADMPAESIDVYLELAALCPKPQRADREAVARIEAFVRRHADQGTLRNRDTLRRMQEAIDGVKASATRH